jgi:hypothetical protein
MTRKNRMETIEALLHGKGGEAFDACESGAILNDVAWLMKTLRGVEKAIDMALPFIGPGMANEYLRSALQEIRKK